MWYFKPGTEERVDLLELKGEPSHYGIQCGSCGIWFTLTPEHGLTFGQDGAITTEHSFNCPKCLQYHHHLRGGVVTN